MTITDVFMTKGSNNSDHCGSVTQQPVVTGIVPGGSPKAMIYKDQLAVIVPSRGQLAGILLVTVRWVNKPVTIIVKGFCQIKCWICERLFYILERFKSVYKSNK